MSIFNECLYSFVWLYLIKCDVHTQASVDQIQKDFWVFYLFLESILIWKFSQKIQNFVTLHFGDSLASRKFQAQVTSSTWGFRNSLASESLSRKKDLEKIFKI